MPKYKLLKIQKSDKIQKKYTATFENLDTKKMFIRHFGYNNPNDKSNDYTLHGDIARRDRYLNRAKSQLKDDPTKPAYLSIYILWGNEPDFKKNVKNYTKRLNIYNKTGNFPKKIKNYGDL
jgi:hypothetical protein